MPNEFIDSTNPLLPVESKRTNLWPLFEKFNELGLELYSPTISFENRSDSASCGDVTGRGGESGQGMSSSDKVANKFRTGIFATYRRESSAFLLDRDLRRFFPAWTGRAESPCCVAQLGLAVIRSPTARKISFVTCINLELLDTFSKFYIIVCQKL
jgi:hypothetical protein